MTDAPPRLSRAKRIAFTLVVVGMMALVLELAGALYLRWTQGYSGGDLLQYQFDPYKNIVPTPNFVDLRGVRHDAQGFRRSTDVSLVKPAGTYRIFLMGASAAYGTGGLWPQLDRKYAVLADSQTIDAYLESMLAARFPERRIEVINAAIPSIWTHHHLIYLNQTILRYDPDMVLFLDGLNDFFYFNRDHDQFRDYAYTETSHVIMGPPTVWSLLYTDFWWLFRKSAFVHALGRAGQSARHLFVKAPARAPILVDSALASLREVFARNALKMIDRTALILREERIPAVFMLQPMLILERERVQMTPVERRMFEFNIQSTPPNYEAYMRRAVPIVSQMESATVSRLGGTYIDLTGLFRNASGQVFTDYAHLTPAANKLLAARVADTIVPMIDSQRNPHRPQETTR